jgi:hypothetical protein
LISAQDENPPALPLITEFPTFLFLDYSAGTESKRIAEGFS